MEKRTINPANWVDDSLTFYVYADGRVKVYDEMFKFEMGEVEVLDEEKGWTVQNFNLKTADRFSEPREVVRGSKWDGDSVWMAYESGCSEEFVREDADPINAAIKVLAMIW